MKVSPHTVKYGVIARTVKRGKPTIGIVGKGYDDYNGAHRAGMDTHRIEGPYIVFGYIEKRMA